MRTLILCLVTGILTLQTGFSSEAWGAPRDERDCRAREWENISEALGNIVRVVDGDTVVVLINDIERKVRMLSIDTPETHFEGKSQGYWGDEATRQLQELLPRMSQVVVELEAEKCDSNGRMLGHVWKRTGENSFININQVMVERALAVNYCIWPNYKYCEAYGRIAEENAWARRGIFSDPSLQIPYLWRQEIRGDAPTKFIGNLETFETYSPGSYNRVSIGRRIFFMHRSDIRPPFRLPGS